MSSDASASRRCDRFNRHAHDAMVLALGPVVAEAGLRIEAARGVVEKLGRDLLALRVLRIALHHTTARLRDQVDGTTKRHTRDPFPSIVPVDEDAREAIVGQAPSYGTLRSPSGGGCSGARPESRIGTTPPRRRRRRREPHELSPRERDAPSRGGPSRPRACPLAYGTTCTSSRRTPCRCASRRAGRRHPTSMASSALNLILAHAPLHSPALAPLTKGV